MEHSPDWIVGDEYWHLWNVHGRYEARFAGVVGRVDANCVNLVGGLRFGKGEGLAFRSEVDACVYAAENQPNAGERAELLKRK